MIGIRSKHVLLVAPESFPAEMPQGNLLFRRISAAASIFPSIHEMKPNVVIFDYDYLTNDMERILRRIHTNPAYNKIKICCYKSKKQLKIDGLLKTLGAHYVFYPEDFENTKKHSNVLSGIFDATALKLLAKASN